VPTKADKLKSNSSQEALRKLQSEFDLQNVMGMRKGIPKKTIADYWIYFI